MYSNQSLLLQPPFQIKSGICTSSKIVLEHGRGTSNWTLDTFFIFTNIFIKRKDFGQSKFKANTKTAITNLTNLNMCDNYYLIIDLLTYWIYNFKDKYIERMYEQVPCTLYTCVVKVFAVQRALGMSGRQVGEVTSMDHINLSKKRS